MAQPGYRDIITSIKKGDFAPVYILMGEEDYYIDLIMDSLESGVLEEADKDFNLNVCYGVDADIESLVACCQQLPVMAPRRLVLLKEAQSMQRAKQQLDKLSAYVKRPNVSTVFAMAFKGDNLNATSELMKTAAKSEAVVFKSAKVRDYQLPGCLKDYCTTRKCPIDEKSVQMMCEYIGGPLTKLFGETNKLITIKGGASRITPEDVERHIGVSKDFNNFELVGAVCRKDYPKAIGIVKYFEANPKTNPTVMTTATLFNFFTRLVTAYYLPDRSEAGLKSGLGLKTQGAYNEIRDAMRSYNAAQAVNAIHAIRDFDVRSKGVGSFQNEYALLLELIFKIFTL